MHRQSKGLQRMLMSQYDLWLCTPVSPRWGACRAAEYPWKLFHPRGPSTSRTIGARGCDHTATPPKADETQTSAILPLDSKNTQSCSREGRAVGVKVESHRDLNQLELKHYIFGNFTKTYNHVNTG